MTISVGTYWQWASLSESCWIIGGNDYGLSNFLTIILTALSRCLPHTGVNLKLSETPPHLWQANGQNNSRSIQMEHKHLCHLVSVCSLKIDDAHLWGHRRSSYVCPFSWEKSFDAFVSSLIGLLCHLPTCKSSKKATIIKQDTNKLCICV